MTNDNRDLVEVLDRELANLIDRLKELVNSVPQNLLYQRTAGATVGENILRSAAAIEQVCGGLTANLWDDPFEWTLPENLSTADRIIEYLSEVDMARQAALNSILDDSALTKYISDSSGEPRLLVSLLLEMLVRASDYRGRAVATLKALQQ